MATDIAKSQTTRYQVAGKPQADLNSLGVWGFNAMQGIRNLISLVGEDPEREGLRDTPSRVVKMMSEMCQGYNEDPEAILATQFSEPCDEMIVVKGIEFWSMCEHHLLPFHGYVTVGYVPNGRIVGLSKIPRLVRCFAKRLQIQERLTQQITQSLVTYLRVKGAGTVIEASHTCMQMRGVESTGKMITSCLQGCFLEDSKARSEFLAFRDT